MTKNSYLHNTVDRATGQFTHLVEMYRTIRCGMDFVLYPMDGQRCVYMVGSIMDSEGIKVKRLIQEKADLAKLNHFVS